MTEKEFIIKVIKMFNKLSEYKKQNLMTVGKSQKVTDNRKCRQRPTLS